MNILIIPLLGTLGVPKSGGENRLYNMCNQLVDSGHIIYVLQKNKALDIKTYSVRKLYTFRELRFGERTLVSLTDFNPDFVFKLNKIIREEKIDLIQFSGPWGIIISKIIIKFNFVDIPVIYDAHDVEADLANYVFAKNSNYSFFEKLFLIKYTSFQERIATRICDHILSVSQEDKLRFIQKYGIENAKITSIPSGASIAIPKMYEDKEKIKARFGFDRRKKIIVFHGSYFHMPNKEAIELINSYIAPVIENKGFDASFVIAGFNVPIYEKSNIRSIGFVEDLYSLLYVSDIAIVPIMGGSGTRIKILDYMGVGLPIVSTKKGIEGINAENMIDAIIVDNINEEFINSIAYLLNNLEERKRLGRNAMKLVQEEYEWNKIGEKLDQLYRKLSVSNY